ncbi:methyltransferase family protein [Prosthecobacter fusiformis]|uniref:Methyltransferase family protein n=1 Tax=Prosthecobacter fusiformis TaxID=48464 RepID=A0A4R7RXX3_9BACT|nr:class I SAM-dependent methyltransferase [Prosthecobacter fusiformis]TDU70671.1 methyltransferase family protein [Prosthecobacter fusiformis]
MPSILRKLFRQSKKNKVGKEQKYKGSVALTYLEKRAHKPDWHQECLYLASLMKLLPDGLRVLDVPFGTGRFLPFYLLKSWDVTGADISEDMLSVAREYNPPNLVSYKDCLSDVVSLPFAKAEFDLVISFRFLGYILTTEKAVEAVRKLSSLTRKHAIFGVQHLREGVPMGPKDKMGHRMYWKDVEALLLECGFSIVKKEEASSSEETCNTLVLLEKRS